ncbi:anti-sigma factor [Bradyrhizobium sp. HKCCYLS20291]|uniref:anti-sigma factor n=1 Tax=Bradyrhizobium sp. HKCCYLS20291 TaxID=3420766 RepID=UPI003EBB5A2E
MAYSEDHIALAAEYALGTLDGAERAQVETMMAVDRDFAAVVQAWELRLGALNQMVGLVEPRAELWDRIKAEIARSSPKAVAVDLSEAETPAVAEVPVIEEAPVAAIAPEPPPVPAAEIQLPPAMPAEMPKAERSVAEPPRVEAPPVEISKAEVFKPEVSNADVARVETGGPRSRAAAPPVNAPARIGTSAESAANDNAAVIRLSSRVRRWRAVANVMTALAAALLALVGVQVYRPDLLPQRLQPKPRIQTVEVKVPAAPEPAAQFVALLQKDAASPAFILTVDSATRSYTVRRVGAAPEAGKSFELWIVSDKLQKPRSLGVIGGSDFTSRPVLSSYDPDIVSRATYAVTVEPEGGSPTGQATGPIVFTGKLIETVPPGK